jgi:(2Fe-2S) ferredoxin
MAKFQRHIFTCINQRPADSPKGCCALKGGEQVASELKRRLYERGFKRIVRPNKSYCLDQCALGVAMVVYPEAVWYGGVTVDDLDEIIDEHIVAGRPVQRLVVPAGKLTGIESDCLQPLESDSEAQ